MSLSATYSGVSRDPRFETRLLLLLIWSVMVLSYLSTTYSLSTDDAMRLVEVRDFLAGQGWFDLTQYRLNPPNGVTTHWSRLIDLPLALLIKAGEMLLPAALAERIATIVWPAALLLVFLAGVSRLARELAGDTAARLALIFAALMVPVLQHFRPGAIDHHNAQLALLIWSLALFAHVPARPRDTAIAGILCALSIAIGLEMAPAVVMLAAIVALRWVVDGDRCKHTTVAFALSLATGTFVLAALTIAPAHYLTVDCDAISIAQVGVLGLGGFGLATLAMLPRLTSITGRLAAAGGLGLLLVATVTFGTPACLADPIAPHDPRLIDLWLSNVNEGRNIFSMMRFLPQEVPIFFALPLAGLVLGAIQSLRGPGEKRWNWIACTATLAALSLIAVWWVRGAAGANALAAALVPAALLRMLAAPNGHATYFGMGRAALVSALLLNPIALIALGSGAARAIEAATGTATPLVLSGDPGTCQRAADYPPLARLPRGRVLAFIDAGPFILLETDHEVLATPYHRNETGNVAMLDIFLGAPNGAEARLAARGIDYVVFCPGAPERYNYVASAPNSLVAALSRSDVPRFLERIPLDGTDLAVYRVRR